MTNIPLTTETALAAKSSRKLARIWREETAGIHPRLWLADTLLRLLPNGVGGRLRAIAYRAAGIAIGPGTIFSGPVTFVAPVSVKDNLHIGARCFLNSPVYIDAAAPVTLGCGVSLGHHVVIITSDHAIGCPEFRAGELAPQPVSIGDGAWIAAGAKILPGVTIGAGAVVAAGAVVTRDVPPNTLVGGVPAKIIRELP